MKMKIKLIMLISILFLFAGCDVITYDEMESCYDALNNSVEDFNPNQMFMYDTDSNTNSKCCYSDTELDMESMIEDAETYYCFDVSNSLRVSKNG